MRSIRFHKILLFFLIPGLLLMSCRQAPAGEDAPAMTAEEEKEMLLRVNKFLVKKDFELISAYADRRGWDMKMTENGLFYEIYEESDGIGASSGMTVKLNYVLSLLDGTVCYSSDNDGAKQFVLGKSLEISGLEQGVELMKTGEKGRFIMPPHLAYGLLGDEERVPARSIIVCEVELLEANVTD
jgi:FKBP-type peptidyl-prolyl cis-trans isomerase